MINAHKWGFPGGASGKEPTCQCGQMPATQVQSLGGEDPLEKETATHSSILAWETQRTQEPGGLQSMGSPRVRHNGVTGTVGLSICLIETFKLIQKRSTLNPVQYLYYNIWGFLFVCFFFFSHSYPSECVLINHTEKLTSILHTSPLTELQS